MRKRWQETGGDRRQDFQSYCESLSQVLLAKSVRTANALTGATIIVGITLFCYRSNCPMPTVKALPPDPVSPAQVLRRFRVVFNAVRTHFSQLEKQVGLGGAQVWALSLIKANPGIGMGGIAAQMDIHQSTASNLIKALLKKELIVMTKGAEDRRSVHLKVLPHGQKTTGLRCQAPSRGCCLQPSVAWTRRCWRVWMAT